MEGWGAKTVTTTTSVQSDKRRLEEKSARFQRFNKRLWGYLDLLRTRMIGGDRRASASGGWTKEGRRPREEASYRLPQPPPVPQWQRSVLRTRWPTTRTILVPTGLDTQGSQT